MIRRAILFLCLVTAAVAQGPNITLQITPAGANSPHRLTSSSSTIIVPAGGSITADPGGQILVSAVNLATGGPGGVTGILPGANGGTGVNNGSYTVTLGGNVTTAGQLTTAGAYAVTLTATAATSLTLPTAGTLVTLSSSGTFTNKTIDGGSNTLQNVPNAALTNSTVGIAGNTVALGGTVTQDQITGLSSTGILKRTGTNTLAIASAGTDYLTGNQTITLSGDASGTGATGITVTVAKVNGVAYGTSPSTNTVPIVTGSNAVTYEAVPNAALAHSTVTVAGNSTALGASVTLDQILGLSSTGLIMRTGTNTLATATSGTDYLSPAGPLVLTHATFTASGTVTSAQSVVYISATTGTPTIGLPASPTTDEVHFIKNNGTVNATISTTLDGVSNLTLYPGNGLITQFDGSQWNVLATH